MATKEKSAAEADVRSEVRQHYGKIAAEFEGEGASSCCAPAESSCGCAPESSDSSIDMVSHLYETPDVASLPEEVTGLSLGCGDPVTLASLEPGQTVLDLGSGGGIDCFLAANQVGETGHVIGVDMTAEMIEKSRANKAKLGAENVEFRLGEIEHLPVSDETVDVVISNCVINLSPDKPQVFREAFRVLRPGGQLAVSDIVTGGPLPDEIKNDLSAWAGCLAGALEAKDYVSAIEDAGFVDVELTPIYMDEAFIEEAMDQLGIKVDDSDNGSGLLAINLEDGTVKQIDLGEMENVDKGSIQQAVFSAKITARKPSE
ncbi:MAG: arsenite methyltransferase [Anaerolineales bacterium]|nr:arsenite methyltransferase [Anaerolineales bacterium]